MARFFVPILLIIAAVGLFVVYTNPTYQKDLSMSALDSKYTTALAQAAQLHAVRDTLLNKRNALSNDDVAKLEHVLPDNVDNIRLIIDVNNIAARHNLPLSGVNIGSLTKGDPKTATAVGSSGDAVGSVQVGFSVTASYDDFQAFLQDLEHSLRIVDVDKIGFKAGAGDLMSYSLEIRTYWLH